MSNQTRNYIMTNFGSTQPPRFDGSLIFPQAEVDESLMGLCIETGNPVFARDIIGARGAKRYFVCGYQYFMDEYYPRLLNRNPQIPPNIHEVLQGTLPTRIYLDLDCKDVQDRKMYYRFLERFIEHTKCEIQTFLQLSAQPSCLIFDATFEEKCSSHIIFDIFLENMGVVKSLITNIRDSYKNPKLAREWVDLQVYGNNRCFRIPWSCKEGKPVETQLLPMDDDKSYNADILRRGLIQARLPSDKVHMVIGANKNNRNGSSSWLNGQSCAVVIPDTVLNHYIRVVSGPKATLSSANQSGPFIRCVVLNAPCPGNKSERHRSNNQFFTYNTKTKMAWLRCSDTECRKSRYWEANIGCLFKDQPLVQVDEESLPDCVENNKT